MKQISAALFAELTAKARASARRRANHNLHEQLTEPVQRFLNAMEPGTYVRPHRHSGADRWELFLTLHGSVAVLVFDTDGRVHSRQVLAADGALRGIEIPGGHWHTLVSLAPGTVVFETKQGPYRPVDDKDFAAWAPPEGHPQVGAFIVWLEHAEPGAIPPPLSTEK